MGRTKSHHKTLLLGHSHRCCPFSYLQRCIMAAEHDNGLPYNEITPHHHLSRRLRLYGAFFGVPLSLSLSIHLCIQYYICIYGPLLLRCYSFASIAV
jgi:hypothetical protein